MGAMRTLPSVSSRGRLWNKPEIQFQRESEQKLSTEQPHQPPDRGKLVASFYRSIISPPSTSTNSTTSEDILLIDAIPEETGLCPTCNLALPSSKRKKRRHNCSTAHLSKVVDTNPPPLNPLPIDRSSYGYLVMSSQGWSEKSRNGIGAEDNKGRREPVKPSRVKNDTIGLGVKLKKKEEVVRKKPIPSGKEIREDYERDKQLTKELMEYMHR
jgi:G-patch domain